jgi:hypothetical protein
MSATAPVARLAEAGFATLAGAGLGAAVGLLAGVPLAVAAGVSAGLNGAFGGYRQVYDWRHAKGWFAFATDSTWGLIGTTLGNALNLANLAGKAGYRPDFSRRQNRHVFERGACMKRRFAFTHGNVISNASTGREALVEERRPFIDRHEGLHVWQNRIFGPIYQVLYVAWFAGGALVGLATWALKRDKPTLQRLVETAAYYDNPFEFWAYKRDDHWEDNSADPTLKWRRPRWFKRRAPVDDTTSGEDRSATHPGHRA